MVFKIQKENSKESNFLLVNINVYKIIFKYVKLVMFYRFCKMFNMFFKFKYYKYFFFRD